MCVLSWKLLFLKGFTVGRRDKREEGAWALKSFSVGEEQSGNNVEEDAAELEARASPENAAGTDTATVTGVSADDCHSMDSAYWEPAEDAVR